MSRDWIKYQCSFCNQYLEADSFIPPSCECDGARAAKEKWLEEIRSAPDYEPPLLPEEYNEKYPVTFSGKRKVGDHSLRLEARKYKDGEGVCMWIPFNDEDEENDSGLAWDCSDDDAVALHELLGEYLNK